MYIPQRSGQHRLSPLSNISTNAESKSFPTVKNGRSSSLKHSKLSASLNRTLDNTLRHSPEEHSCDEFIAEWSSSFNENDECSQKLMNVFAGASYASSNSGAGGDLCSDELSGQNPTATPTTSSCSTSPMTATTLDPPSPKNSSSLRSQQSATFQHSEFFTQHKTYTSHTESVSVSNSYNQEKSSLSTARSIPKKKSRLFSRLRNSLHISATQSIQGEDLEICSSSRSMTPPDHHIPSETDDNLSKDESTNQTFEPDTNDLPMEWDEETHNDSTPDTSVPTTAMTNFHSTHYSSEKQENLLIFLLARSFKNPAEMKLVLNQLVKSGYLSERALDSTYRKKIIQSFVLNTLLDNSRGAPGAATTFVNNNFSVNTSFPTPKNNTTTIRTSKMKRSRSASSFFDPDIESSFSSHSVDELRQDLPAMLLTKAQQQNYLSQLPPFLASLPYTTSRFRSDFCEPILLGKGGFGAVYRVSHKIDGREYAIKRVKFAFKNPEQLRKAYEKVIREVRTLSSMDDHSGIVRYHNAWFEPFLADGLDSLASEEDGSQDTFDEASHTNTNSATHSENPLLRQQGPRVRTSVLPDSTQPVCINTMSEEGIFKMDDDYYHSSGGRDYFERGHDSVNSSVSSSSDGMSSDSQSQFPHKPRVSSKQNVLESIGGPHSGVKFDMCTDDSSSSSPDSHVVGVPESPSEYFPDPIFMKRFGRKRMRGIHGNTARARRSLLPQKSIQDLKDSHLTEERRNSIVRRGGSPPNAASIDQPHIRNILQSAFKNGKFHMILCIQMQLCTTVTLEDWLWSPERQKQRRVDTEKIVNYMRQILSAVSHMHSMGIIHRDIKPSNVFITKEGTLKIGDFGLAKSTFGASDDKVHSSTDVDLSECVEMSQETITPKSSRPPLLRQNTRYVGTQTYAAPEQMTGSDYSEKVDIFSIGIMFFEMFHPFSTKTERAHVLMDLRRGRIPASLKENYPEEMELIQRCLSKTPEDRPSAEELISFLNRHLNDGRKEMSSNVKTLLKEKDDRIRELEEKIRLLENSQKTRSSSVS